MDAVGEAQSASEPFLLGTQVRAGEEAGQDLGEMGETPRALSSLYGLPWHELLTQSSGAA